MIEAAQSQGALRSASLAESESETDGFADAIVEQLPGLRAYARSLTGDPVYADDLLQETFLKALRNEAKFQPGTNLRAWLFTILRNTMLSDKRKTKREVEDADGVMAAQLPSPAAQHGHMDMLQFKGALAKLSEDQREALLLVGGSGFAYDEAAKIIGCATGTVKSRVGRARARLSELMELAEHESVVSEAGPSMGRSSSV